MNPFQLLARKQADYELACRQVAAESVALRQARLDIADIQTAQQLAQGVATQIQTQAHASIAGRVSSCLAKVFAEEAYEFKINFVQRRGKTEAVLTLLRDGLVLEDPLTEAGGGVVDVAAFALRLSCLLLAMPRKRRLLVLDEPMKNVNGKEFQDRVGALLLMLAVEMNVQFVIVTDDDWLKIGKVIHLKK